MNSRNKMDIINNTPPVRSTIEEPLKTSLHRALVRENLDNQRALTKTLVTELDVDFLDFSAALLYLYQKQPRPPHTSFPVNQTHRSNDTKHPGIRLIRYRLEVGHKHQATLAQLTKVLVEESGVDKNNIHNVDIQNAYTFIEMPDEMPHDIFLHLKSVEINHQKLDIKRVKNRSHKKRAQSRSRRSRHRKAKLTNDG